MSRNWNIGKLIVSISSLFLLLQPNALAAPVTTNATFTGTILSTCILTAGTPGIIAANANYTDLSSTNAGGQVSTVSALTTGPSYTVTTLAPSAFTVAPAGGSTSVSFNSSYSLSGATTASGVSNGVTSVLGVGTSSVTVNLDAAKTSGTFTFGAYTADVTVRCE